MEILFTVSSTLEHALAMLALLQNDHIICLHVQVCFYIWEWGGFFPNGSLFIVWNNEARAKDFKQGMFYLLRCSDWVEASEHIELIEFAWEWPQMPKIQGIFKQNSRDKIYYCKPVSLWATALIKKKKKKNFHCFPILCETTEPSITILHSDLLPKLLFRGFRAQKHYARGVFNI